MNKEDPLSARYQLGDKNVLRQFLHQQHFLLTPHILVLNHSHKNFLLVKNFLTFIPEENSLSLTVISEEMLEVGKQQTRWNFPLPKAPPPPTQCVGRSFLKRKILFENLMSPFNTNEENQWSMVRFNWQKRKKQQWNLLIHLNRVHWKSWLAF